MIVEHLRKHGTLTKISEEVHFAQRHFGRSEVIDFLAVLFGYSESFERTLEEFSESLQPFAIPNVRICTENQGFTRLCTVDHLT